MKKCLLILLGFISTCFCGQTILYNNMCMTTMSHTIAAREIHCAKNDMQNNKVYFGGNFSPLSSYTIHCSSLAPTVHKIARVNTLNGQLDSWNPNPNNSLIDGEITSICKMNSTILLGGNISNKIPGPAPAFKGLVGVDENNGTIVSTYSITGGHIHAMDFHNGWFVAAGSFTNFNGYVTPHHIIIINTETNQVYNNFSNMQVNNPSYSNYTPGNNGYISQARIINGRILAVAEDPSINARSLLQFNVSNLTITRRLSFYVNGANYSFNRLCEQNDTLYIFPHTDDIFLHPLIKIVNNLDMASYGHLLPWNLQKSSFAILLQYITGLNVRAKNFDPTLYPPTYDNNNYYDLANYTVHWFKPQVILQGNKFYVYFDSETAPPTGILYKRAFYKNGTECTESNDAYNLNQFPQINFERLKALTIDGDHAFAFRKTKTFTNENSLECFCIKPDSPFPPLSVASQTIFCRGVTYTFVIPNPGIIKNFSWGYTGNGANILNSNNDTVQVSFSLNATPGKLFVTGTSGCMNVKADTGFRQINFMAPPQLSVLTQDTLNCKNFMQSTLNATSLSPNTAIYWLAPSSPTTPIYNSTLSAGSVGLYTAVVTQTINGCRNFSVTNVIADTAVYSISGVNSSYTVQCKPNYLLLQTQPACTLLPCYDSVYWEIGSATYPNPHTFIPPDPINFVIAKSKNTKNGCINSFTTTIFKQESTPSYTIMVPLTTPSVGLPEFEPLTCTVDSVMLDASALNSLIQWKKPNGDTLINPCYANNQGVYQLLVLDTVTGCQNNSFLGLVSTNLNPPQLILNNIFASLNCSYSTATLNASSNTPMTQIKWLCPVNSFTASNPATTTLSGWYYAEAVSSTNGCSKLDSVLIQQSNKLFLTSSSNSIICYGNSIHLSSSPIGGTPPFIYTWSNNNSNQSNATYTNLYSSIIPTITITDALNCVGMDTIRVTVAKALQDSVVTFKSCDNENPSGQIQIYTKGGVPPYKFSLNGGLTFQNSSIFPNLSFGNYTILIKDSIHCERIATATISPSSFSPKIDFIVQTTMMQQDTFVIVDISNPRPDSLKWFGPNHITFLNGTNAFNPVILCPDTGSFYIKAKAYFSSCVDSLTKLVRFVKYDTLNTKNNFNSGIKTFNLFPNPNNGYFSVEIEFFKPQSYVLKFFTNDGSEIYQSPGYHGISNTIHVQMPVSTLGSYFLKIISEFDVKQKSFIINH